MTALYIEKGGVFLILGKQATATSAFDMLQAAFMGSFILPVCWNRI